MKFAIGAALLAVLVVCAGCASPTETEAGPDVTDSPEPNATENEFGAHPQNPPNATNATEDPGTLNPPDNETLRGAESNETGGTETSDETDGDETDTIAFTPTSDGTNATAANASARVMI